MPDFLIKGDITETIPEYINKNPHLKISLLHLDVDIFKPTITALEFFWEKLSRGGILVIDDYNSVEGATIAVDQFLKDRSINDILEKTSFNSSPSFLIKS